ncbi:MAG: hypothetical protein C0475_06295 [Planctomyces sp.]|nr:hypothetical protein [Planctomyces sp.]
MTTHNRPASQAATEPARAAEHTTGQAAPGQPLGLTPPTPDHGKVTGSGRTSRREVLDRRTGSDRRNERSAGARADQQPAHTAEAASPQPDDAEGADEALSLSGLERRRGPGRRLSDFQRSAEEGDLTSEQFLFVAAIDAFKRSNNKTFPTWTDVLEVVRLLGYRKTMASELRITNAEDWREPADAAANVRPQGWERRFAA